MSDTISPGRRYGYHPPQELSADQTRAHAHIDALLDLIFEPGATYFISIGIMEFEAGHPILPVDTHAQIPIVIAALDRLAHTVVDPSLPKLPLIYSQIASHLLRRRPPVTEEDLVRMLIVLRDAMLKEENRFLLPVDSVLAEAEAFITVHGVPDRIRPILEQMFHPAPSLFRYIGDHRELQNRIEAMLGAGLIVMPGEYWTDAIIADLHAMEPGLREWWERLLVHASSAASGAPSPRWLSEGAKHLNSLGADRFAGALLRWLSGIGRGEQTLMLDRKVDLLRGLVWYCRLVDDPRIPTLLCDVGLACLKKVPSGVLRAQKGANACINTLGALPDADAIAQLARMRLRVKNRAVIKTIDKALDAIAARAGLSREEMEEIAVPTYGLGPDSRREDMLGSCSVTVDARSGRALLQWKGSGGKRVKSVPAEVRSEYPEELAALKRLVKDLDALLDTQRNRIERMFLLERSWPYQVWRERYLEHPLVGVHARRLIWRFIHEGTERAGIWHDGTIADYRGRPLEFPEDSTLVRLWSPIGASVEEVLQWRIWLEVREIVQPFKQAHREVYILTDAERATGTYSNRFAGHILRHHQFAVLCRERGWRFSLQVMWDGANTSTLDLPEWGLQAEFWVEPVGDNEQISEAGMALYISTDQVRFYSTEGVPAAPVPVSPEEYQRRMREWGSLIGPPLPLENIPPIIFSEVMRDVDLFTGVCSVGTDPAWNDAGERGQNYWETFSFGDLSATAQTRRDLLGRLIPRLKIAGRCTLQDRFLLVRGDLRSYRIHLGSGNILMEPNDQYLCIVPARGWSEGNLFVPFEGDRMLSVILSKAFLLADDVKITDPTILSQIRI